MHPTEVDPVSFMAHAGALDRQDTATGPLAGTTLAVKDLYDIKGLKTGAGNPSWLEAHDVAGTDSWAVAKLMAAGSRLIGKTLTDEMAYSLIGASPHYGTPPNPAAPDCIPGGSSSGSASVVAQGLVDIALGTDTGGSVRIPASFCGLYGIRPTHGRIPLTGVMPLGESFDTVGWFARKANLLKKAGEVLLDTPDSAQRPKRLIILKDLFQAADDNCRTSLQDTLSGIRDRFANTTEAVIAPDGFEEWRDTYRYVQGYEAWRNHAHWIETCSPVFGGQTQSRFDFAREITEADFAKWTATRTRLKAHVLDLIGADGVLAMPTAPGAPIRRDAIEADFDAFRARILDFTAYAGVAGTPQVTIPVGRNDGGPVGLSLIGAPGSDRQLLEFVAGL